MSAVNGFHRPALESLTPKLVDAEELPAVSALASLRGTSAAIAGPALAGVCIATLGLPFTFGVDAATFAFSLVALRGDPRDAAGRERAARRALRASSRGCATRASRPELIGTYVVDIVAMTFAMPMARVPRARRAVGRLERRRLPLLGDERRRLRRSRCSAAGRAACSRRGAAVVIAAARLGRRDRRARLRAARCRWPWPASRSRARPTW